MHDDRNSKHDDKTSPKLADDDGHNEEHEDSDDGNGDYPVCSHPVRSFLSVGPQARCIKAPHYLRAIPLNVFTLRST